MQALDYDQAAYNRSFKATRALALQRFVFRATALANVTLANDGRQKVEMSNYNEWYGCVAAGPFLHEGFTVVADAAPLSAITDLDLVEDCLFR